MAHAVRWSPQALDDLDEIAEFIARDSVVQARLVVAQLCELSDSLAELPERGRRVPDLERPKLRELFLYSYRMLYRVEKDEVVISAVVHGSRILRPDDVTGRSRNAAPLR